MRRVLRLTANAGLVVAVYWLDAHTAPDVRLGMLYAVPVVLVTWQDGLAAGIVFLAGTVVLGYAVGLDQLPVGTPFATRIVNEGAFALVVGIAMAGLVQLHRTQRDLARLATYDQLTGALTSPAFTARLAGELERSRRYHRPLALLYVDLDDFKAVNDRHGHGTGDAVLRLVGDAIQRALRQADVVGRLGGDEFAVLMPETEGTVALAAATRLAANIRGAFQGTPSVTASIGVVASGDSGGLPEELLRRADTAMYEAKRGGKDRVIQAANP
ncbi:MAG TPA: GGDEF domain-containing protein [Gemmatimonadales bacterium]|nr:GGDEF domain-containing protein [Gemmatimonadales bacterium]